MRIEDRRGAQRARPSARSVMFVAGVFAPALLLSVLVTSAAWAESFSAADVYRNAAESVVLIFGFEDSGSGSSGTGSILTRDGLVLTNNHVISKGEGGKLYSNLVVYFKPKPISGDNRKDLTEPYLVDVVARDADLDLALLRVKNPPPNLRPMEFGDSEEVDIGESVAAIGHPGGGGLWTLTTGTVSSKRRDAQRDIFQTDTAINPGNSGGPLLDQHSRLVGVNTFVRRVNDQGLPLEGLNYSLRSSLALRWVNQQGVTRVGAVTRASVARTRPEPKPAPRIEPEPEPEPEPRAEVAPPEPAPERAESRPRPAPESTPAPAPSRPSEWARPEPAPEPKARAFTTPDGTEMYGVPNMENDLHEALQYARKAYADVIERSNKSVRELEDAFDDYDNF